MSKAKRTALVTGASGLPAATCWLTCLSKMLDVIAVSRRKPRIGGDYRHIAVDLLDPADCQAKLGPLTNITHLFYLAITERADPGETISANANMFFNLVKTVEAASPALEHVHLSQGTRCTEITSVPIRLRPRRTIRGTCHRISITISRIFSKNPERKTLDLVGWTAACGLRILHGRTDESDPGDRCLCQHLQGIGAALSFPGKPGAYTALYQCTDAALLAKAVEWMATDRNAQTRLSTSPTVISSGGRTCGPSSPTSSGWSWLRHDTSTLRGPWRTRGRSGKKSSEKNGLQNSASKRSRLGLPGRRLRFRLRYRLRYSKARRFGFHDLVDTEEMFFRMFSDFGVSGSFRGPAKPLAEEAQRRNECPPFDERSCLPSMDSCRVSLVPERQMFRRATFSMLPRREQVVDLGEKYFEKRGRVCPVVADHQIDGRYFALQWAADDRWRKKILRIEGSKRDATRGYNH